jgi:hypothetical protein
MNLEKIKNYYEEYLQKEDGMILKSLKLKKESKYLSRFSHAFGAERAIQLLHLYPNETKIAKALYFKTARGHEFEFHQLLGKYPQFPITIQTSITSKLYDIWPSLVLCDHEEIFMSVISEMQAHHTFKANSKDPDVLKPYAFFQMMNGNFDETERVFGDYYRKSKFWSKALSIVMMGIVRKDIKLINEGIKFEISQVKNNTDYLYWTNILALAKLAMRFGLEPDISGPRFITNMLIKENVDYEDIDNLFDALGVVPVSKYKLKNY